MKANYRGRKPKIERHATSKQRAYLRHLAREAGHPSLDEATVQRPRWHLACCVHGGDPDELTMAHAEWLIGILRDKQGGADGH